MNSPSIGFFFMVAGILSLAIHNLAIGPVVLGPISLNEAMLEQPVDDYTQHLGNIKLLPIKKAGKPL